MAGKIITQSRPSEVEPIQTHTFYGPGWTRDEVTPVKFLPVQTTTSYRSDGARTDSQEIKEFTTVLRDSRKPDPLYDTGHEFSTFKQKVRYSHPDWSLSLPQYGWKFRGPLVLSWTSTLTGRFPDCRGLTLSQKNSFGARAISATAPTKSDAGLATAVGEIVIEGNLPRLLGESVNLTHRANHFRSLGNEYLNVQFGWIPFVSDIIAVVRSLRNASKTILQLERDSDRWVRRSFHFPTEEYTDTVRSLSNVNGALYGLQGSRGEQYVFRSGRESETEQTIYHKRDVWFKGAFSYHFSAGSTRLDALEHFIQKADKLLGIAVTPEVLWNVSPWSWFADWFGNIGDVLANASLLSDDALVLRYGYLMSTTREVGTFSNPNISFVTGGPGTVTNTFSSQRKERHRATPYGFALELQNLSVTQWAIMAALGLTKSPRYFGQGYNTPDY